MDLNSAINNLMSANVKYDIEPMNQNYNATQRERVLRLQSETWKWELFEYNDKRKLLLVPVEELELCRYAIAHMEDDSWLVG